MQPKVSKPQNNNLLLIILFTIFVPMTVIILLTVMIAVFIWRFNESDSALQNEYEVVMRSLPDPTGCTVTSTNYQGVGSFDAGDSYEIDYDCGSSQTSASLTALAQSTYRLSDKQIYKPQQSYYINDNFTLKPIVTTLQGKSYPSLRIIIRKVGPLVTT